MDPTAPRAPADLLDAAMARDPGRPLVTFYDDATGERVELSTATFANWVAKTAGLLTDGLGTAPGDVVRLDLPRHWLTAVWAVAAWRTGCVVALGAEPGPPAVAVCGPAGLAAALASGAGEVVAVSLRPLGAPYSAGELPPGALDYAREVPLHADRYDGPRPGPGAPALAIDGAVRSGEQVVGSAAALAAGWAAGDGARLLVSTALDPVAEVLAAAVVPLLLGGSVVLCAHPDPAALDARSASERVTVRAAPSA